MCAAWALDPTPEDRERDLRQAQALSTSLVPQLTPYGDEAVLSRGPIMRQVLKKGEGFRKLALMAQPVVDASQLDSFPKQWRTVDGISHQVVLIPDDSMRLLDDMINDAALPPFIEQIFAPILM